MSEEQPHARKLIVELHDVAPPFEAEIRAQLDALAAIGIDRCVLNVVPNWHGAHPLPDSPTLVGLLHAQRRGGSEFVLHGLEHRRRGPLRGPLQSRARAALFAGDAAEFLTLVPDGALESVREGRAWFELAGLPSPDTFCAPGWLLAPDLRASLAAGGIRRIVSMFGMIDPKTSRYRLLPAIGHMGASPLHEAGIQLGNHLILLASVKSSALRLYLHPQGGARGTAARRALDTAAHLVARGWQPATYAEVTPEALAL